MHQELPGIAFEKVVAALQAQIDPSSSISHNEIINDRLGHARQFDIVIRGTFAGQQMLGVIECKDLKRRVGTPEIDAFVTKAQDINANFKILMSRTGFSRPALEKCAHYGIQALSLLEDDPANRKFFIGTKWTVDLTRWGRIAVSLHFAEPPDQPIDFAADQVRIKGKRVLDWFTNYLLDRESEITDLGWVISIMVQFEVPQIVHIRSDMERLCVAISFQAERVCDQLERLVGINGTGFFNWNLKQATFPPGAQIKTDGVPIDFTQWAPRTQGVKHPSGFIEFHITGHLSSFERVEDVPNLEVL